MRTKLVKKIRLTGTLEVKTGLHIGSGNDSVKIGGIDAPVVRAVLKDNQPYIPGSSLKGKIRSLLELAHGRDCLSHRKEAQEDNGRNKEKLKEIIEKCKICSAFGSTVPGYGHSSRIIFRDAYLTQETEEKLEQLSGDLMYTEAKTEVSIDRISGKVKHGPWVNERIPAGSKFTIEIVVNVFDDDNEDDLINLLKKGIHLLNNDYLGGSGSRGYGQVEIKFYDVDVVFVNPNSRDKNEQNAEDNRKNGDQIESQESKSPENKPAVSDDKTEEEIKIWRSALEDAGLWIDSEKDKCNESQ